MILENGEARLQINWTLPRLQSNKTENYRKIFMTLMKTAYELKDTTHLIQQFTIKSKNKDRIVNNPIPTLKECLKDTNKILTQRYIELLKFYNIDSIAQAYLPNKSIKTNAEIHKFSKSVIKFDFSHFYDDVKYEYFEKYIKELVDSDPNFNYNKALIKRLIIDPNTNGVTQGLPVSGALAGIALIPFWIELKKLTPSNIIFTQYSDDLIFSYQGKFEPKSFTISNLTQLINKAMIQSNRKFTLNTKKTCKQSNQFRKITGVRINTNNQATPSRKDYRWFRLIAHKLSTGSTLDEILEHYNLESKSAFVGKISYLKSIDDTGKINKIIQKYANAFIKHDLFKTWIYKENPFA